MPASLTQEARTPDALPPAQPSWTNGNDGFLPRVRQVMLATGSRLEKTLSKRWSASILEAVMALTAGGLGFTLATDLLDTEAGGGRLAGPLVRMCLYGSLALLPCAALSFTRWAGVAVPTLVAALLCLPLFLYRIAPSLLTWISDAPASVASDQAITVDPLAAAGLVAIGLLIGLHARLFTGTG